jgi:hypothetical protein
MFAQISLLLFCIIARAIGLKVEVGLFCFDGHAVQGLQWDELEAALKKGHEKQYHQYDEQNFIIYWLLTHAFSAQTLFDR